MCVEHTFEEKGGVDMSAMLQATEQAGGGNQQRPGLRLLPPVEQEEESTPAVARAAVGRAEWAGPAVESDAGRRRTARRPVWRALPDGVRTAAGSWNPPPPASWFAGAPIAGGVGQNPGPSVVAPTPGWQLTNRGMALALAGLTALLSSGVATVVWGFLQVSSAPLP